MPEKLKQQLTYVALVILFIAVVVLVYIGDFSSHKPEQSPKENIELNSSKELKIVEPLEAFLDVNEKISIDDNATTEMTEEVSEAVEMDESVKLSKKSTFSCIDCKLGSYRLSSTCKQRLQKQLKKFHDVDSLEIIGVIDQHDFVALEKSDMDTKELKYIRTLASEGLGFLRVNEAAWYINKFKSERTALNYVNYVIKSSDERGFVLNFYD